jgi:CheY-like chemotaxis protein
VIDGLALQLRRDFEVLGATSGAEGLVALRDRGPFAVVVSDMRMPKMDGAAFLGHARALAPDTTRVLLTGFSELEAAIRAINQGGVFRFLTKPCAQADLRAAIDAAVEQHRLVTAERVLLEQTLRGSVRALSDILALANPAMFGRATRVRHRALELAAHLALPDPWALEVAMTLSHLGEVTVPDVVLARAHAGEPLSRDEQAMLARAPEITERLLANIPRLERVRAVLAAAGLAPAPRGHDAVDPSPDDVRAGQIARLAVDFDELASAGTPPADALDLLRSRTGRYDARALDALADLEAPAADERVVREVSIKDLVEGMVVAQEIRSSAGMLLVARGLEVTASMLERLANYGQGRVKEPLYVVSRRRRDGGPA